MKNLNIINKILTVILLSISLYFNKNFLLEVFIFGVIIVIFSNLRLFKPSIIYLILLICRITGINIWFDSDKFYYLITIIGITILMVKSLTFKEKRYVFDNTLYKSKDAKSIKKHIYNSYYNRILNKNINEVTKKINSQDCKYLANQIDLKTKSEIEDIYILNRIRFYGLYNRKRTIFPDSWNKIDTLYLGFIIIVSFSIIYFR